MGPGWATPYNLIVIARNRPLTTPALLADLNRFQLTIATDPTVDSVTGPGAINSTSVQLQSFGPQLRHSATVSNESKTNLLKLIDGLGQAGSGSKQLQAGLSQASSGASQLQGGSGQAHSGASQLHSGLAEAQAGSATLSGGLQQALAGAQALKTGADHALIGSQQLVASVGMAQGPASQSVPALNGLASATASTSSAIAGISGQAQSTAADLSAAVGELGAMTTGRADPHYQSALAALQHAQADASALAAAAGSAAAGAAGAKGLAATIAYQATGLVAALDMLHSGAATLSSGIAELHEGNSQLAGGISQLSGGGGQLTSGLSQLTAGSAALHAGLGQLTNGAGQLASGLAGGVGPAGQLINGLGEMQAAVVKARGQIPSAKQLEQLERQSPGLFSSGYFVLAAVAGASAAQRNQASFTINLTRGGTAGQIMVVSKYAASDPRTVALGNRLVVLGRGFGVRHAAEVAVGGPAGNLGDLTSVTKSRVWLDVAVLAIAIALVLMLATRAILLPIVATIFSLLVAASTFGVLQLLFGGANPPLGGPGYLDPMSIIGTFTVVFAITMTWATLLLTRTREAFVTDGRGREAIRVGLRETAAAATGAGLVMVAALVPFTATDLLNVRAFGIGVAVAILLDTLIVRPVLLPAAGAVLGRSAWWPTKTRSGGPDGGGPDRGERSRRPAPSPPEAPAGAEAITVGTVASAVRAADRHTVGASR